MSRERARSLLRDARGAGMLTGGCDIRWFRPTSCSIHNSGRQEPFWPSSGISPHKKWGKFRWTAGKEKGVGFRLHNHSPSFSFSRYEDRERRRGNRAGGCRRKRNALASRGAHQGIIVWGSTLVYRLLSGLGWHGNGRLPWVTATRRKGTGGMGSENAPCCRPPDALRAPVQVRVDIYRDIYAPAAGRFNERLRINVVDGRLEM